MSEELEFVFSFRSPYAWIAMRRVLPLVHPETQIRWTPFLPRPSFRNFGGVVPGKVRHILQDILRLSRAYQLPLGRPPIDDSDWQLSHAASSFTSRFPSMWRSGSVIVVRSPAVIDA